MNVNLLRPLKSIQHSFASRECLELFEEIASRNWLIRFSFNLHRKSQNTFAGRLLILAYGLATYLRIRVPQNYDNEFLAAWAYENERLEIERVIGCLESTKLTYISLKHSNLLSLEAVLHLFGVIFRIRRLKQLLRIIKIATKRNHFLPLCQGAALVAYHIRLSHELSVKRPKATLVATLSHPVALALISSSQANRVPSIFSSHASSASGGRAIRPWSDLAILDGEASLDACRLVGEVRSRVVFKGIKSPFRRMKPDLILKEPLQVGVFLSAPINLAAVKAAVIAIRRQLPSSQILIRPHPVLFLTPDLTDTFVNLPGVDVVRNSSLVECLERVKLVFSGNSNVHLEVLRAGIPSVFVSTLDTTQPDYYGFVAAGIVMDWKPDSELDLHRMVDFFTADWEQKFKRFDASYLEEPNFAQIQIRSAIEQLLLSFQK